MTVARWWRWALVLGGLGLFAYLIADVGLASIAASFRMLSWRLLVVLVFPCTVFKLFDTLGWLWTFPGERPSLFTLLKVRLVGQAVNATTPTGTLGGDAVKAWLLRDRVSPRESVASLIVVKTTMLASQGLFLALGVLLARHVLPVRTPLLPRHGAGCSCSSRSPWSASSRCSSPVRSVAASASSPGSASPRRGSASAARDVDRALVTFYRRRPGRLSLSVACNLLGWLASAGETWLILRFLGVDVSIPTALVIEAFSTGVRFATFFVPAQIGVAEGGIGRGLRRARAEQRHRPVAQPRAPGARDRVDRRRPAPAGRLAPADRVDGRRPGALSRVRDRRLRLASRRACGPTRSSGAWWRRCATAGPTRWAFTSTGASRSASRGCA